MTRCQRITEAEAHALARRLYQTFLRTMNPYKNTIKLDSTEFTGYLIDKLCVTIRRVLNRKPR